MQIYPRFLYLILCTVFVSVLYAVRFITLTIYPESFQFLSFGLVADMNKINIPSIIIYILFLYSLAIFIPNRIFLERNKRLTKLLQNVFYIETILLFIVITMGARAGVNFSILDKLILFLIYSLIPINLVFFCLVLMKVNTRLNTLLFLLPTVLMASKSGMIFALILILSAKLLKKEKVFTPKIYIGIFFVVISYPLLISIASFKRIGEGSFLTFLTNSISNMGQDVLTVYGFVLVSISRRVSGLDVLMIKTITDNFIFSPFNIIMYFLKGVFTASFIDTLMGTPSYGIGRMFAIEFLDQNKDLANGFEPTIFGVIFHSTNPLIVSLFLYILCLFPILFFRRQKNSIAKLLLCYFILVLSTVIMSGTIVQLTQVFKFYLVLHILYYLYSKATKNAENSVNH